ncbi:MAG TPA: hypothetical protein VD913_00680 [bacterium]|nr:hypothetical protein [bacterium]
MSTADSLARDPKNRKVTVEQPTIQTLEDERLWKDIERFSRLIPAEPEPNMGRVQEIREEIEKGHYLRPEVLEETAARLVIRFMKKE